MRGQNKERGVALVLVLALVALVAAWAATAAREDWISLRRAENMGLSTKAWMAVESWFELSRLVLKEDAQDGNIDSLDEIWAQPTPKLPVDDGSVSGEMIDANRYFNLNDLVGESGEAQTEAVAMAKRLFVHIDLPVSLVDSLVDWMDADKTSFGTGGAEDIAYRDQPVRVKNAPLDRMEEVLLVAGFDADALVRLRTVAVVRLSTGITSVNINTARKEVLLALAEGISEADAEAIMAERSHSAYAGVAELTVQPQYAGWAGSVNVARLSVQSDAFIVRAKAHFGRAQWGEEMMLTRREGMLSTIYRTRLGWTDCPHPLDCER